MTLLSTATGTATCSERRTIQADLTKIASLAGAYLPRSCLAQMHRAVVWAQLTYRRRKHIMPKSRSAFEAVKQAIALIQPRYCSGLAVSMLAMDLMKIALDQL